MEMPILVDECGRRWSVLTAARFGQMYPGHRTWRLQADLLQLHAKSARDVREHLRVASIAPDGARIRGFYLRGDQHHLSEFYDVTEQVATTVRPGNESAARRTVDRLLGREVVRTAVVREQLPNLWSRSLRRLVRVLGGDVRSGGILLASDWMPPHRPGSATWPWDANVDEDLGEDLPWLFVLGHPSVSARGRYAEALARSAMRNLRCCVEGLPSETALGMALPLSEGRAWAVSPMQLAQAGVVPVLAASACRASDLCGGEALLRVAETAVPYGDETPARVVVPRGDATACDLLRGWGLRALGSDAAPRLPISIDAAVDPSVLVIRSREDGWAHGWDADSCIHHRLAANVVKLLVGQGVPVVVTDEGGLHELVMRHRPELIVLGPGRSLRTSTVEVLCDRVDSGGRVVAVEPVPRLVEGEHSSQLDRLIVHRRTRRIGEPRRDLKRDIASVLRKLSIPGSVRLFRRGDGLAPEGAFQVRLSASSHVYATVLHREDRITPSVVEVRGEYAVEIGVGGHWSECAHWQANENTYVELDTAPSDAYLFRLTRLGGG